MTANFTLCPSDHAPVTATIADTTRLTGMTRWEIHRLLAAGRLRAVKSGSRTLVLWESVRAHLASLPPATYRGGAAPTTAPAAPLTKDETHG